MGRGLILELATDCNHYGLLALRIAVAFCSRLFAYAVGYHLRIRKREVDC